MELVKCRFPSINLDNGQSSGRFSGFLVNFLLLFRSVIIIHDKYLQPSAFGTLKYVQYWCGSYIDSQKNYYGSKNIYIQIHRKTISHIVMWFKRIYQPKTYYLMLNAIYLLSQLCWGIKASAGFNLRPYILLIFIVPSTFNVSCMWV